MRRLFGVGVILLLTALPGASQAQDVSSGRGGTDGGLLGQNYPNPFNPTTRIPFTLPDQLFEAGEPLEVTIRIFNVLHQLVAIPKALDHPSGNGVPVDRLTYSTPGEKAAFWDGLDVYGRKVASGLYYYQLVINGRPMATRKMLVTK